METLLEPIQTYGKHRETKRLEGMEQLESKANVITFRFKNELTEHRFLASNKVNGQLDALIDFLWSEVQDFEDIDQYSVYCRQIIDDLYLKAEDIALLMDKELNIGGLNDRLFKRLLKKPDAVKV